jgi:hypothetical protein
MVCFDGFIMPGGIQGYTGKEVKSGSRVDSFDF